MNRFTKPTHSDRLPIRKVPTMRTANMLGVLVVLLAVTTLGFEASARGTGHRSRPGPAGVSAFAEKLGIDAQTRAKIEVIEDEGRTESRALRLRLKVLKAELRELLGDEEPDEARVMSKADTIGEIETQGRKIRLRTMIRVRALLTPDQRHKLVRIHAKRKHRASRNNDGPRDDRRSGSGR